jgi:hypothetical protein
MLPRTRGEGKEGRMKRFLLPAALLLALAVLAISGIAGYPWT